jgi:DNA-binding MarR family transcriptional regulator
MSTVPERIAKGRGDGFELSMVEIARHVGVTTSGMAKAVARLEEEG